MFSSLFGFGNSRPPLATAQRVSIELFLRRTIQTIGRPQVMAATMVTELSELRLDMTSPHNLLTSAAKELAARLWIGGRPLDVTLTDHEQLDYRSTYEPARDDQPAQIRLADDTIAEPLQTVMELAYQFSLHFWVTQQSVSELDTDTRNTHLLPICGGLGVLASDASLCDKQWSTGGWSGWSMSRSGYYNAEEIGYALALLARTRGETEPAWVNRLRLDSRVTFRNASRYFEHLENNGGQLLLDATRIPESNRDMTELANWLRGDDPAFALAAGYALLKRDDLSPLAIQAALDVTRGGDRELMPIAARLLGAARTSEPAVEQRLQALIQDRWAPLAFAALQSAAQLNLPIAPLAPRIAKLLDSTSIDEITLLELIAAQGESLRALVPRLCRELPRAAGNSDTLWFDAIVDCLVEIVDDPADELKTHIKSSAIRERALRRAANRN